MCVTPHDKDFDVITSPAIKTATVAWLYCRGENRLLADPPTDNVTLLWLCSRRRKFCAPNLRLVDVLRHDGTDVVPTEQNLFEWITLDNRRSSVATLQEKTPAHQCRDKERASAILVCSRRRIFGVKDVVCGAARAVE